MNTELQGPGFFMFFQEDVEAVQEQYSGGWFDYGTLRERFIPKTQPEEEAAPIINRIAEKILQTKEIETNKDIELILRLKLEQENLRFKQLYLTYLIKQAKIERNRKASIMLLLH